CLERSAVGVDRCAREGARDRAPVSRSRPAACRAARGHRIYGQAKPGQSAPARHASEEGGQAAGGHETAVARTGSGATQHTGPAKSSRLRRRQASLRAKRSRVACACASAGRIPWIGKLGENSKQRHCERSEAISLHLRMHAWLRLLRRALALLAMTRL